MALAFLRQTAAGMQVFGLQNQPWAVMEFKPGSGDDITGAVSDYRPS